MKLSAPFVILIIAEFCIAGILSLVQKDWARAGYWLCAAGLNVFILVMK